MPLDYSLLNAPQIDVMGNYQRGVGMSQQNAQNQMQQMEYIQQAQRKNRLSDLLKSSGDDYQTLAKQLAKGGFWPEATAVAGLIPKQEDYTIGNTRVSGKTNQPIFTGQKIKEDYTLGDYRMSGETNQPISAATSKQEKTPDILSALRASGIDPSSPKGRQIIMQHYAPNRAGTEDKVPMGYQRQPDGTLRAWTGGPADIKEQAKSSAQETGRENVSQTIASLRDAYNQLQEGGGITDPNKSGISNLTAGIQSSGLGQASGRMFGTQNQSKRNEILMTRPALLQHIMKATGMSAKQMDSNAELKLWLATATDPTLDISANINALDRIEKTYGIGGEQPTAHTQTGATGATGGLGRQQDIHSQADAILNRR